MPKTDQKYDNQAMPGDRKKKAMKKVSDLVSQGYRINASKASTHYNREVEKARRNRFKKLGG